METAINVSLLILCLMGIVTQIFIGLVLLRLVREVERWQKQPIVLPAAHPVICTLPAIGLSGGAVRFELDNGTRVVLDLGDGDGPLAKEVGSEMIATFQRIER